MDAEWWPVREERLLTVHTYCESSKSLEGDRGMDRMQQCRLLPSFQEGAHQKLFFQEKNLFIIILQARNLEMVIAKRSLSLSAILYILEIWT